MAKKDAVLEKAMDQMTAYVNDQVELAEKCFALYQTQVEKVTKQWTDVATKAAAEAQGAAKAWMELGLEVVAGIKESCEASIKEATKAFTPAA